MSSLDRRRLKSIIDLESLESRRLLAAFGTPWPQPRDLSVSFPADAVQVANYTNNLRATLDQIAQRQQWEELALRAYQTWAIHADINVGLRNDYDLEFGAPGLLTNDPRFGEFRIGAFPQTGVVASSLPFQTVAGTWAGDLLLDSDQQFKYHDWIGGTGPDPSTLGENDIDLFSVLLHESGNTLGLDDSLNDWTVMFRQYTVPKGVLSQEDISAIQTLYGARTDPFEQVDNGQLQVATLIPVPVGFDPQSEVLRTRASLVNATDVDHFQITPLPNQGFVTIRLKAAGISLLKSRVEILDESGQPIDQATATSVFANDNTLQISGLQSHSAIYVRVSAADPNEIYSVGDYELEVDYRPAAVQASDPVPGSYDSGADTLFSNYGLLDDEQGADDSVADAVALSPLAFHPGSRHEIESSVSSAADVDFLKVTAPSDVSGRLVIHLAAVGTNRPDLKIRVVDSSGQNMGAAGRLEADGSWTLEIAQPQADQEYYLRVSVDPTSIVDVGNYIVTAEFTTPSSQMNHLASGDVSSSMDEFIRWSAGKTKLFRFDLTATGGADGEMVKLTIYDAQTREMRAVIDTRSDVTRSAFAWLHQGDYILRFTAHSQAGAPVNSIGYSLTCDGLSDDQDEDGVDSEDDPNYDPYNYYYNEPYYDYYDYDSYYYYYYYYYYP